MMEITTLHARNIRESALTWFVMLATIVSGVLLTPEIMAQQSESAFEEIVVTAQKREQSIYDVPASISAFSADTVERAGITDLIDVGKFVPNLNVTNFSAGHTSSANPFIRGIGLQDHLITTDPGVGVYVDGVYLGRQLGQNWNLTNIERLEILRGPQGTLYGRNSIGGAINIITRKPGDEEVSRASMEAGTRDRINADYYSNFKLSDDTAVLLSGAFKHRGGVGKFLNLPDADVDVGELQDIAARAAIKWSPTDRFSLLLTADGNQGNGGLNPYTTLIDEVPNGGVYGDGYRNSDVSDDPYDSNTGQLNQTETSNSAYGWSATASYHITSNLDAKLLISQRRSEYEAGLDDDSFLDDFLSFPEEGFAEQDSVELQLNGEYGKIDFVSGIYYFKEEGANDQFRTVFLGGPGSFYLQQEVESYAIYANVGYALTDALRIAGGLRFTEDEKKANVNINDFLTPNAKESFDDTSWELSATYDMNNHLTAYGTIQSGYQSGQFPARPFCLFGSIDTSQPGNVDPMNCFTATENITALNYEAGIKGQPFSNLQMSLAVFRTDYSDLPYQVSTTTTGGFNTVNLVVDQTSTGIEWESNLQVARNFYIHTSIGYIDVEVDHPVAVAPLTPELTASISPEYSIPSPWALEGTLIFRADYSFRDDMYGEPSPDPGRYTKLDSRELLNFNVSYLSPDKSWTLSLYGKNITDERYDSARLNTGDYILRILSNDPREFGVRLSKTF